MDVVTDHFFSSLYICSYKIFEWLSRFAHTNPLHLDVFQSVVKFESEVVAMTAALLGSKEKASGGQICGNMTSGGTESILMAVKSSRDYMKTKKGITNPEMSVKLSLSIFPICFMRGYRTDLVYDFLVLGSYRFQLIQHMTRLHNILRSRCGVFLWTKILKLMLKPSNDILTGTQ